MRKEHLYTLIGGSILVAVLLSGNCFGTNKHVLVKLKGNVLYATHCSKTQVSKQVNMPAVAVQHTKKIVPVTPAAEKSKPNALTAIDPEAAKVVHKFASDPVAHINNYERKMENLHAQIFGIYPGTYLDSMAIVYQLLNDSLRGELAQANTPERSEYLKLCLISSTQDSTTLSKLSLVCSGETTAKLNGELIAHCKDATNSTNVDSVVMDVFSGSTLMASASSDKNGTIQYKGIPEGNYYVVFSRRAYTPFSLMRVNVSNTGQSYIDVPLSRNDGYLFRTFGNNAWLFVVSGIVLLLAGMITSAYYLAKYNARKALHTA